MSKFSVLAIARGLLRELKNLHCLDFIHKDLKPQNILVEFDDKIDRDLSKNVFKFTRIHLSDYWSARKYK